MGDRELVQSHRECRSLSAAAILPASERQPGMCCFSLPSPGSGPCGPSLCHYALHPSVASHFTERTENPRDPKALLLWASLGIRHGIPY